MSYNTNGSGEFNFFSSFVSLFEDDADVAQKILQYPRYFLPLCEEAAISVQEQIAKSEQLVKKKVTIRAKRTLCFPFEYL